jgi:adenylate kinase family enzyme
MLEMAIFWSPIPCFCIDFHCVRYARSNLYKSDCVQDGFPRTVRQAELMAGYSPVDVVLNITMPEWALVEKLLGRRYLSDLICVRFLCCV